MPCREVVYLVRSVDLDGGRRGRTWSFDVAADLDAALDVFDHQSRPIEYGDGAAPFVDFPRRDYCWRLDEAPPAGLRRAVVCWRRPVLVELLAVPLLTRGPAASRRPLEGQAALPFAEVSCIDDDVV